jgi:acetyltransferase-like isoleucine patch superfamily enzyme
MWKAAIQVIFFVLPWPLRRRALNAIFGFSIDASARVGLSIIFADEVSMAGRARIGHFNYIGQLDRLELHEESIIGNFNWIAGLSRKINTPFYKKNPGRRSELLMKRASLITHQHYIDCSDRIEIGMYTGIAGFRSQLVTHGIEPLSCRQTCAPIIIGDYSMIGSGSQILKGVRIPNCCLVSAGSVVNHVKSEPYSLIAGNPAVHVRKIPETAKYFSRTNSIIY